MTPNHRLKLYNILTKIRKNAEKAQYRNVQEKVANNMSTPEGVQYTGGYHNEYGGIS